MHTAKAAAVWQYGSGTLTARQAVQGQVPVQVRRTSPRTHGSCVWPEPYRFWAMGLLT